jgi:hypothetical protein
MQPVAFLSSLLPSSLSTIDQFLPGRFGRFTTGGSTSRFSIAHPRAETGKPAGMLPSMIK